MPRRGNVAKREVLADPIYNSKVVTRLVNYIMLDGKKGVAQEIVYDAFDIVKEKTGNDPLESFEKALENIMPVLEVKARRVRVKGPRGECGNALQVAPGSAAMLHAGARPGARSGWRLRPQSGHRGMKAACSFWAPARARTT